MDNNNTMIPEIDLQRLLLFEDDNLVALNKPSGVLTIPGGYSPEAMDLKSILEAKFGKIWVIHRLDKETSGIVLFALNAEVHRQMNLQFDQREISKEYRLIAYGVPRWKRFNADQSLLVDGDRSHRTILSPMGKPAQTDFEVLHRFPCFSYLRAKPHTGLTHQIRAHLSGLSHPILMDGLYASEFILPEDEHILSRMALHAFQISFKHPVSGLSVELSAPLPADFRFALDHLPEVSSHEETDYNKLYNTVTYQVGSSKKSRK